MGKSKAERERNRRNRKVQAAEGVLTKPPKKYDPDWQKKKKPLTAAEKQMAKFAMDPTKEVGVGLHPKKGAKKGFRAYDYGKKYDPKKGAF